MDARKWLRDRLGASPIRDDLRMRDALLAVLDLHVPTSGPDPMYDEDGSMIVWCAYCAELDPEYWDEIAWPCTTVRRINSALGVE